MKLAEKILDMCEMGKPRKDMVDLFESLRETIVEHIWKIYAYGKNHKQKEVNTWLKSLNKHLTKLRKFNIQKGSKSKKNLDKAYLKDKLIGEDFEGFDDIALMANRWVEEDKPFPVVMVSEKDVKRIHVLVERYIDLILGNRGKMTVAGNELGDL